MSALDSAGLRVAINRAGPRKHAGLHPRAHHCISCHHGSARGVITAPSSSPTDDERPLQLDKYREQQAARGVQAGTCLVEGQPALAIVEHAEKRKAMMLVLGTHGRSGFRHLLIGSVAERVVRMATVPVLTVHLEQPQLTASV